MNVNAYVPLLKGKLGELNALRELPMGTKSTITPLIDTPPMTWDYKKKQYNLEKHLEDFAKRILKSWEQISRSS